MILVVVLGLLTMMALALLTYVLVAAQAKRTSRAAAHVERRGDAPQMLLHQAAMQVIRGTNEPMSVLQNHSLLEDMYGNDGVAGQIPFVDASFGANAFNGFAAASVSVPNGGSTLTFPTILKSGTFLQIVVSPNGPDLIALGRAGVDDDYDKTTDEADEFGLGDDSRLADTENFYNGRIFTMVDGPAAGQSTRIVGYSFNSASTPPIAVFTLLPFDSMQPAGAAAWSTRGAPRPGDRFVINGLPFNGTGFGLDPSTYATATPKLLDAKATSGEEFALLPNPVFMSRTATSGGLADSFFNANYVNWRGTSQFDPSGPGGADEDYDAPDYQNMLLGMRTLPATGAGFPANGIIPSLHRPELLRHWMARNSPVAATWTDISNQRRRRAILRPDFLRNPNFPTIDAVNGPWDVDNDGDGINDSIWVDLGMPVQTAPDGRKYKPIFAIQCLDMDGKLNLNAHGNVTQIAYDTVNTNLNPLGQSVASFGSTTVLGPYAGGGTNTPTPLPVGLGHGPAEINLSRLFANSLGVPTGEYNRILGIDSSSPLPGRYGEFGRTFTVVPAGFPQVPGPGLSFFDGLAFDPTTQFNPDWESLLQHYDLPGLSLVALNAASANLRPYHNPEYALFGSPGAYGTPPDVNGNGALGLDLRGVPYWGLSAPTNYAERTGLNEAADRATNPYKINLSWQARERTYASAAGMVPVDAPFTPEELERLLRTNDLDASMLPDRLLQLAPQSFVTNTDAARRRNAVTTESWDLPSPSASAIPNDLIDDVYHTSTGVIASRRFNGIVEILRERLRNAGFTGTAAQFNTVVQAYLPPEVIAGQRLDLNRPLGNGIDDDGDLIVDESDEATVEDYANSIFAGTYNFDLSNDGIVDLNDELARQALARQLYCLVWMLVDDRYVVRLQNASGLAVTEARQELARQIAQWSVNVVDFRDRDSIMTSFEYDVNPFTDDTGAGANPWNVDGIISAGSADNAFAYRGLVWGTERPELLLTETLGTHDRRTEDTADENPTNDGLSPDTLNNPTSDGDTDFDQRHRPEGSLFVEIYNPTSPFDAPPREFYREPDTSGVQLDAQAGGDPVWRMLIVKHDHTTPSTTIKDPDDPDPAERPTTAETERSVYFTGAAPTGITDGGQQYYRATGTPAPARLLPGRYAVIGPDGGHLDTLPAAPYTTTFGKRGDGNTAATRSIVLNPSNVANEPDSSRQVAVENNTPAYPDTDATGDIQPPIAVVIGSPRRLSVSEPTAGYPPVDAMTGLYNPVLDTPLDASRAAVDTELNVLLQTGTTPAFRIIHLQRLANPTLPWDEATNPYLTIDSMPVDLTAFNGEEDPDDGIGGTVHFESRERGDTSLDAVAGGSLWTQEVVEKTSFGGNATDANHIFGYELRHTFGYVNDALAPLASAVFTSTNVPNLSGTKSDGSPITAADYRGTPMTPFPWFAWLNRPFANQYELLQVPAERSSKLLAAHTIRQAGDDPYQPMDDNNAAPWYQNYAYRHLPNFFYSVDAGPTEPASHLYRLFDYVHVPSRFAGTEEFLNPLAFDKDGDNTLASYDPVYHDHPFHPPYNRVSRYREPGKININTIGDEEVWRALTADHPGLPSFTELVRSRRGYTVASPLTPYGQFDLDSAATPAPTLFANPFRSFAGNDLVPLAALQQPIAGTRRDIETTLLRSKRDATTGLPTGDPLFAADSSLLATNTTQNPYFRYLGLQKLGNNVTTRSNVYAVWITVGYFEVEESFISAFNGRPDGYELGAELGSDTGNIQRHRAFYLIDRSIPVAFERGRDYNVENCILIKRFIE